MHNLYIIHQNCVYACNTPIQEAIALGFEKELTRLGTNECYFISLPHELETKRNFMAKILTDVGMKPIIPEGGYFMVTNWSSLESHADLTSESDKYKDYRFTKWMTKKREDFVRYCFIKRTVALSTQEAEYMALTDALLIKQLLSDMNTPQQQILICNDNTTAQELTRNPLITSRSKHINIKEHFIREKVQGGEVAIDYKLSEELEADLVHAMQRYVIPLDYLD
ncbi:hypothetical protein ILUMI_21997 [Ignelater luminosus]|uniref:Copia protein n=1 Tax=Ignelater luminosus TaxID=2038154 RepID=A0A8K0CHW9_IGNLU|nr:hypothetical protein ILUMI_21997 [Ignelater luminosus]